MEIIIVLVFVFISKKDAYNLIKNATIIDKKGSVIDTSAFHLNQK